MDYMGMNGGLGLTTEQTDKVLQFQELTGIEDITICRDVLQRHHWNLEVAVQEQLNIREGRPSLYATETRPPAVISDHLNQHVYYTPPTDGSGSGIRGLIKTMVGLFWNLCYGSIITLLQIGRRLLAGIENRRTDGVQEVMEFIQSYDERYGTEHPVFYQGTFSQVLSDAKHELRFLLVYLHSAEATDTNLFCRETLSNPDVIRYINTNFLFWGCSVKAEEGRRALSTCRTSYFPFMAVLVLRENSMTIVGRLEGHNDAGSLVQRLVSIVNEFEINLVQARAVRFETNMNRSLRQHQDEAFLESLKADQEKERRREQQRQMEEDERRREQQEAEAEKERIRSIAREKIESADRIPEEPDATHPDAVHILFKLPCGRRLERRFLKSHSLEHVFYFVFCHPDTPNSFEISANFPKRVLICRPQNSDHRIQTVGEAGLVNREILFIHDLEA